MTRALFSAVVVMLLALHARADDAGVQDPEDADLPELKGEAKARIRNIEQLIQDWDIEGAKAEFDALEKLAPADVVPVRYFRGRLAFEEGRYQTAIEELAASGVRDKKDSWLRLVKDTAAVTQRHVAFESAHFIFLAPPGKDAVLAPWALDALEQQRAALEQDLGYAPPGKVRVEVVNDATELSKVSTLTTEAIKTTGTIAICKFNKLMVTSPKAVVRGYDWLDTLAHEYTHLVVSRKSHNTVPIWMHEGLAKYLESRWRGPAGGAMNPSTLALLGSRVRKNDLVPFAKMHPSMALLPTAQDAATAFAEVFFAISMLHADAGPSSLERLLSAMAKGSSDQAAVEAVTGKKWPDFERAWMAFLRKQPYPKELIPASSNQRKELIGGKKPEGKPREREISFGDFAEVQELDARRGAHLGELLREQRRMTSAALEYEKAWRLVGNRYESVSNKYALTLLELNRLDEAQRVLEGSLTMHPGSEPTNVHLGRIAIRKKDWPLAKRAFTDAMAVNPFDPEVQLGLLRAATALKDAPLIARMTDSAALVVGVPKQNVAAVAAEYLSHGLLEPLGPEETAASDAGPSPAKTP